MSVKIKNNNEINQMSSCGKIISDVREIIVKNIEPGISTWELDKLAEEPEDARFAINNAKISNKSKESEEIINFIDGLTNILELKFLNAYKLLT